MKQRPILFSTPMVLALLAGTKTQTRRVIKPQPDISDGRPLEIWYGWPSLARSGSEYNNITPPYGRPGDILWVRESLQIYKQPGFYEAYRYADGEVRVWEHERPEYDEGATVKVDWSKVKKTPSIHVPAKYCRLFLQIKSVRVERLQDISEVDAIAEGVYCYNQEDSSQTDYKNYLHKGDDDWGLPTAVKSYETLWQSINGPESWAANPFVWVVEFEKIDKPA